MDDKLARDEVFELAIIDIAKDKRDALNDKSMTVGDLINILIILDPDTALTISDTSGTTNLTGQFVKISLNEVNFDISSGSKT